MYYRQQGQPQFIPGFPTFPGGGGGNVDRRLERLERQVDRLEREVDQINRRLNRVERRLGLTRDQF